MKNTVKDKVKRVWRILTTNEGTTGRRIKVYNSGVKSTGEEWNNNIMKVQDYEGTSLWRVMENDKGTMVRRMFL